MLRGRCIARSARLEPFSQRIPPLATPNYSYEKRQRELAKKRKLEEKKQRKQHRPDSGSAGPEASDQSQGGQEGQNAAPPSA